MGAGLVTQICCSRLLFGVNPSNVLPYLSLGGKTGEMCFISPRFPPLWASPQSALAGAAWVGWSGGRDALRSPYLDSALGKSCGFTAALDPVLESQSQKMVRFLFLVALQLNSGRKSARLRPALPRFRASARPT